MGGEDTLKKKIVLIVLLIAVIGALFLGYKSYGRKKANDYVMTLKSLDAVSQGIDISENVKIEKIIKQTPSTLVVLVKWGNNERTYLTINKWMTRSGDTIEIDVVDKSRSRILYE